MISDKRASKFHDGVTPPSLNSLVSDVDPLWSASFCAAFPRGGSCPPSTLAIAVVNSGWLTRDPEKAARRGLSDGSDVELWKSARPYVWWS